MFKLLYSIGKMEEKQKDDMLAMTVFLLFKRLGVTEAFALLAHEDIGPMLSFALVIRGASGYAEARRAL